MGRLSIRDGRLVRWLMSLSRRSRELLGGVSEDADGCDRLAVFNPDVQWPGVCRGCWLGRRGGDRGGVPGVVELPGAVERASGTKRTRTMTWCSPGTTAPRFDRTGYWTVSTISPCTAGSVGTAAPSPMPGSDADAQVPRQGCFSRAERNGNRRAVDGVESHGLPNCMTGSTRSRSWWSGGARLHEDQGGLREHGGGDGRRSPHELGAARGAAWRLRSGFAHGRRWRI
jgi:hypothetical protein